jgi:hypothetical protein
MRPSLRLSVRVTFSGCLPSVFRPALFCAICKHHDSVRHATQQLTAIILNGAGTEVPTWARHRHEPGSKVTLSSACPLSQTYPENQGACSGEGCCSARVQTGLGLGSRVYLPCSLFQHQQQQAALLGSQEVVWPVCCWHSAVTSCWCKAATKEVVK